MKVSNIKERLIKKANKSSCKYRVSAVGLNSRGTVIISACNTPRLSKYGGGCHAEMTCMKKAPKSLKTIIILRVGSKGQIRPIDPCDACDKQARQLGIKI